MMNSFGGKSGETHRPCPSWIWELTNLIPPCSPDRKFDCMDISIRPKQTDKLQSNKKITRLSKHDSNDRWGAEFTDSIYLMKKEDGTYRLYSRKNFDGETHTLDRVCGIQTPEEFMRAYSRICQLVEHEGTHFLVTRVAKVDKRFARDLQCFLDRNRNQKGNRLTT